MDYDFDETQQKERKRNYDNLMISPARPDVFDENTEEMPFAEAMRRQEYEREKKFDKKTKSLPIDIPSKKSRWDKSVKDDKNNHDKIKEKTKGIKTEATPSERNQWDETPGTVIHSKSHFDGFVTPVIYQSNITDTPHSTIGSETPSAYKFEEQTPRAFRKPDQSVREDMNSRDTPSTKRRTRWDETPATQRDFTPIGSVTPGIQNTPKSIIFTPGGSTPAGPKALSMATPINIQMSASQRYQCELEEKNRYMTDVELDEILPPGFRIVNPPAEYRRKRLASNKITATPTPGLSVRGFEFQNTNLGGLANQKMNQVALGAMEVEDGVPMKPEDLKYFHELFEEKDVSLLTPTEKKTREVKTLVFRIKNGVPRDRRSAMREITKRAVEFGPRILFECVLEILVSPTLEDQERHLLVKLLDRIMYKLEDKVRPYVHKILVVIMPMLVDEDRFARQEGREIISNLSKAAGLTSMISVLRPDIDNMDDGVRKVTACSFAVVAHALGLHQLLPFLKAVCKSKKSWQARHTGMRIVQQIAVLLKCGVLPHLKSLVNIIESGLADEKDTVRTMTALAISALAEAAFPYGIESFDSVLKPLWSGIKKSRGKQLAAIIKAIGYLVPLMQNEYGQYYVKETMLIVVREFQTPDENMKIIILSTVKRFCDCQSMKKDYLIENILTPFFKAFWVARNASNKVIYPPLVDCVVSLCAIVGIREILNRILSNIKDDSDVFRRMSIETIDKVLTIHGTVDVDERYLELLIDGLVFAFDDQSTDQSNVTIESFGSILKMFGMRCKPYVGQLFQQALFRMNNRSAKTRQQAADIISKIAPVMKICGEEKMLIQLGQLMFEYLGEEYPDVLGSIVKALEAVIRETGVEVTIPPINEILPRLTPILKNRNEKVQENCINIVGFIAEKANDQVSSREWMRICFDLIEILKSPKKSIRRAAINSFGYIANAVGPADVIAVLLNNLKVQERQNRICSTVAIAVVADMCKPFTVLPAVMNEYRVPDMNVQNGVLKSLSFMFEYIGEVVRDYVYAVAPLLAEALTERDVVHRQTAISAVSHLAINIYGCGCEDVLIHLLNNVWPNMLDSSPHLQQAFMLCLDCMRVSLGSGTILPYVIQGLYHPAKIVRNMSWRVYNTIYIGNPDSMVATFPRVDNEDNRKFIRYMLQYRI